MRHSRDRVALPEASWNACRRGKGIIAVSRNHDREIIIRAMLEQKGLCSATRLSCRLFENSFGVLSVYGSNSFTPASRRVEGKT